MNLFYFFTQQTVIFFIPLLITALGGMFCERSGVVNIALEGIMIIGAFCGVLFIHFAEAFIPGQTVLFFAVIIAASAGALISAIHAYASVNMKANQIISGTAINMFAPAFVIFTAKAIFTTQQVSFENRFNSYILILIGLFIFIFSWILLFKTRFGLRLRSCGENPSAADGAGINVYKMKYAGVLISGALAGIGGLAFIIPTSVNFNATVSGYGFLALAVLIFGRWKPFKIFLAALFFAVMKAVTSGYSGINLLNRLQIPDDFYKMIPYLATLFVLAFTSKKMKIPMALGIPYNIGDL